MGRGSIAILIVAGLGVAGAAPATSFARQSQAAVSSPDAAAIEQLLAEARALADQNRHDEAVALVDRALAAARAGSLRRQEGQALLALAVAAERGSRFVPAREHGMQALAVFEATGDADGVGRTSLLASRAAEMAGDLPDATRLARQAIAAFTETGDRPNRARARAQLVRAARLTGTERTAMIEEAIVDAQSGQDRDLIADLQHSLGDGYFISGQYEQSLAALQRAAQLFQDAGRLVNLGTVYNSIGRVYRVHGQFQGSLDSQLKALEIHERAQSPFALMQSLNAVASALMALNQVDRARAYQDRAVAIAERIATPRILDFANANLANILLHQGEYARAATLLEGVIARGVDSYPHIRLGMLANAYLQLGRHADALAAADKMMAGCDSAPLPDCIHAYQRRAEVHIAMRDDTAALADIKGAISRLEELRTKMVPSDFFKERHSTLAQGAYNLAIALQLRQQHARDALETAEHGRARAFLDLLASRDIPPEPAASAPVAVPAGPAPIRDRPDSPVGAIIRQLPSSVSASAASADDLVALAKRLSSTLLVYWVNPDEVCIWVVMLDGRIQSARVPVAWPRLAALVAATVPIDDSAPPAATAARVSTRGSLQVSVAAARSPAWRELYDVLVRPVRDSLPAGSGALLTIVPHGPLNGLSFAALQDARGRYLLEDYTLHYAPAGNVLQATRGQRRAGARTGPMLVVADATPPRVSPLDRPLGPLPGARAEAQAISGLVPRARLTQLIGGDATETRVRQAAAGKAVIHVATHAIARDSDPFASYLAVGPGTDDQSNGFLTAREIYDLKLDADLVVLSACQSGAAITGDGVATFARAFIHAGAPSIIVSQWDVPDEPTSSLLAGFYRSWLAGQDKARALRSAQLQTLRALREGRVRIATALGPVALPEHPVFWAGFALVGEPE